LAATKVPGPLTAALGMLPEVSWSRFGSTVVLGCGRSDAGRAVAPAGIACNLETHGFGQFCWYSALLTACGPVVGAVGLHGLTLSIKSDSYLDGLRTLAVVCRMLCRWIEGRASGDFCGDRFVGDSDAGSRTSDSLGPTTTRERGLPLIPL
jgi:hypothetical protein